MVVASARRCDGAAPSPPGSATASGASQIPRSLPNRETLVASGDETCGIGADGRVVCWGDDRGAHAVAGMVGAVSLSTERPCGAIRANGELWYWGDEGTRCQIGWPSPSPSTRSDPPKPSPAPSATVRGGAPSATVAIVPRAPAVAAASVRSERPGRRSASGCARMPRKIAENAVQAACTSMGCDWVRTDGTGCYWDRHESVCPPPVPWPPVALAEIQPGFRANCRREATGRVGCRGEAAYLGGGRRIPPSAAYALAQGITDAVDLAVADHHACAALGDGTVRCWGENANGQLGDGTVALRAAPVRAIGLTEAVEVAVGPEHSCAVRRNGEVWCWGSNHHGQLGVRRGAFHPQPIRVPGIEAARHVATGDRHTCAELVSGQVWCWGGNDHGQLGAPATPPEPARPRRVEHLPPVQQVALGVLTSCALTQRGDVICWGDNSLGQQGTGSERRALRGRVAGLRDVVEISTDRQRTCALTREGAMYCWGGYDPSIRTRFEDPRAAVIRAPEHIQGLPPVRRWLFPGWHCAIDDEERTWCLDRSEPYLSAQEPRLPPIPAGGEAGRDVVAVEMSMRVGCALERGGWVSCWRYDLIRPARSTLPERRPGLSRVVQIAVEGDLACALDQGGTITCWDGSAYSWEHAGPQMQVKLDGAVQFDLGGQHICAVTRKQEVWCWPWRLTTPLCMQDEAGETLCYGPHPAPSFASRGELGTVDPIEASAPRAVPGVAVRAGPRRLR